MNHSEHMQKKMEKMDFSGILSIEKGRDIVLREHLGYQDLSRGIPINGSTAFAIASGNKAFTALGIGRLIERGKLKLNHSVKDILKKDFSFIASRATLEDLLCHRSGIFDYFDEETMEVDEYDDYYVDIPWYKLKGPKDYLPLMEGQPPKFSPGQRVSYSNGGYVFLAHIIEEVSGLPYKDFIHQEVLKPAGMSNSGIWNFNRLPDNTAWGYKEENGELVTNIFVLPPQSSGDGGLYSNVQDMAKFWRALNNNKILSAELTKDFLTPRVKDFWQGVDYGLGFYLTKDSQFLVGCDAGVGFQSRYYPKEDVSMTIISNRTEGEEAMLAEVDKLLDKVL